MYHSIYEEIITALKLISKPLNITLTDKHRDTDLIVYLVLFYLTLL